MGTTLQLEDGYLGRKGTSNSGFENEYLIPALFALRVIGRTDIINMSLATNVDGMGAFDDVILSLEYENKEKSVYIIQLKHTKGTITASTLKNSKDYCVYKYQEDYEKIMQVSKYNENVQDINFIIYSTSKLSLPLDEDIMKQLNLVLIKENMNQKEFPLLNTNAQNSECIYKFRKGTRKQEGINENFLLQFYIFTEQGQIDSVEQLVYELISERYGHKNESIKLTFLDYVKKWNRGDFRTHYIMEKAIEEEFNSCNTSINMKNIFKKLKQINLQIHYPLKKEEIQLKLTELLLEPYVVDPKTFLKFKNRTLWSNLVDSANIIVIENYNQEMVSLIWHALNVDFCSYFGNKLKEDTSWENDMWLTTHHTGIRMSMKYFYKILWNLGYLPLMVKAEDTADVDNISKALLISKKEIDKRKVILLYKKRNEDIYEAFKSYSVIQTLADVKDTNLLNSLLEAMTVSLQERKPTNLSNIVNIKDKIFEDVPVTLVLTMLNRPLVVGRKYGELPNNYIKRKVGRVSLKNKVLQLQKTVFVVYGSSEVVQELKLLTDDWRVVDSTAGDKEINIQNAGNDSPNVFVVEEDCKVKELRLGQYGNTTNGRHYLRYYNSSLEWIYSVGSIENIKEYVYENRTKDFIDEDCLLYHFTGKVNIISSNPGMGKSVMINFLAEKCWNDHWVNVITLGDFNDEIEEDLHKTTLAETGDQCSFYKRFKKALLNVLEKKRNILYLVDAFDELLPEQVEVVTAHLRKINNKGFPLWITTRPTKTSYLEDKMNTFSLVLDPISVDKQTLFLKNYFSKTKGKNADLFVTHLQNIISKSFSKLDLEFSSVPLHLYMIAEVFEDKSIDEIVNWKEINTIDLYETFIIKKIKIYLDRMNVGNRFYKKELVRARNNHARAALLLFYQNDILNQIIDLQEIQEFLKETKSGEDNAGIITFVNLSKNLPVFIHRTFAEYLTAEFLSSQLSTKNIKPLLLLLFKEELTTVRELFDKILAKNCPLHLAVLNNDLEKVETLMKEYQLVVDSDSEYDLGGRTPLHLAAAWGIRHLFPKLNSNKSTTSCFQMVALKEIDHRLVFTNINGTETLRIIHAVNRFLHQTDKIFGWHPIDYAIHSQSIDTLNILFDSNQTIDFPKELNLNSLTFYCVKYGYSNILMNLPLNSYIFETETLRNIFHVATQNKKNSSDTLQILLNKYDPRIIRVYLHRSNIMGAPPLMYTALKGDINVFKILLKQTKNINLNEHNAYGLTLLHCLVFYSHEECLREFLINPKINVNIKTKTYGKPAHTAIYFAINNNHLSIIKLLIEKGADLHLTYENKRTVIHVASINGFNNCIKELLYNDIDLNTLDKDGKTPLHYAVQNAKLETVNYLLQLGVDINKSDIYGRTFLHYSVYNLKLEELMLPESITSDNLNSKDKTGKTALHYLVKRIKLERINYLLSLGKNHEFWFHYGSTPTYRSSKEDRMRNMEFLINSGADVDAVDCDGQTPLQYAIEEGDLDIIECLLKLEADINKNDNHNRTPLFNAVRLGKINAVIYLLEFNPNVDKCDALRRTPLHIAVDMGFIRCVQILIENNANVNSRTSDGCTPLFIAVIRNYDKLVQILLENGANVNKPSWHPFNCVTTNCSEQAPEDKNSLMPLHMAIKLKNIKIIKCILESKIKINQTDSKGWTALHYAVDNNYIECIEDLMKRGAGVHLQDVNGYTPIYLAAKQNNTEILEILLKGSNCKKAIDIVCDRTKQTALHIAASSGYLDCVKALTGKGAKTKVYTYEGLTPFDLAVKHGHKDVQTFLRRDDIAQ